MNNFGKHLRNLRLKAGLSMDDVVLLSGGRFEKTGIWRMENLSKGIYLDTAYYLSKIYGVDIDDIARAELESREKIKGTKLEVKKRGA